MAIPGNDLLSQLEQQGGEFGAKLGIYVRQYLVPSIEKTAQNAAVDTQSQIAPPAPPESVNVATAGEYLQVQINHTAPIQKGIHHIVSIATNPQFIGAMVHDIGASRSPMHYQLPTKDSHGNTHSYYVAVQTQYPGSQPSRPTVYGGGTPAAITLSGTTQMDILPGTGSGTATSGAQTLVGLGKSQVRVANGS